MRSGRPRGLFADSLLYCTVFAAVALEIAVRLIKTLVVLLIILVVALIWLTRPGPVDAVGWDAPPPPPATGALVENTDLRQAALLGQGMLNGPEAILLDDAGNLFSGTADGRIVRIDDQGNIHLVANTGGRPLGMALDNIGRLIVADAARGLLRIDADGRIEVLVDNIDGTPLTLCDDVTVGKDGTLYFTDASSRFPLSHYRLDLIEGRPHGRLLAYHPDTGALRVLLDDLYFANGVTLSPDEDFVLVNETFRYRIRRFWLSGSNAGQDDLFADNLPGFPDNLSRRPAGDGYWVAIPSRRNPDFDQISHSAPLRNLLARLPQRLQPSPEHYGMVLLLDNAGEIVAAPQDPGGALLHELTSAVEHDGHLYLGSLSGDRIGKWPLPPALRHP